MIATVTLNPAIDKTMTISGFTLGKTNRARIDRIDPGGKGVNVAKAVRQLGCPVLALGFLASGNGGAIAHALVADGIATDFISVSGDTRVNLKIKDPDRNIETEINEPGFTVEPAQIRQLEQKIEEHANRSCVVVFSGSFPQGAPHDTYARLIRIAADQGARTILDADGIALRMGMAAHPDLAKPNRAEAEELLGRAIHGEKGLLNAGRMLLDAGARCVVVSLGSKGAIAAFGDRVWLARPPAVDAVSTVGAGDAMVAALACAMLKGLSVPEALRLAVAAGSATATVQGSAVADFQHVQKLLPEVVVEELGRIAGVMP